MVEANTIASEFRKGAIDRRSAIKLLLNLGFSAPMAYSTLGFITFPSTEAQAQAQLSVTEQSAQLKTLAAALSQLVASPEVMSAIDDANKASEFNKPTAAQKILQVASDPKLMDRVGIKPPFLRISMRVFELDLKDRRQPTWGVGEVGGSVRVFDRGEAGDERMPADRLRNFMIRSDHPDELDKAVALLTR
jgi:hypothetical protein